MIFITGSVVRYLSKDWIANLGPASTVIKDLVQCVNYALTISIGIGFKQLLLVHDLGQQIATVKPVQVADGNGGENDGLFVTQVGGGDHGVVKKVLNDSDNALQSQAQQDWKDGQPIERPPNRPAVPNIKVLIIRV